MTRRDDNRADGPVNGLGGDGDPETPDFDLGFAPYYRTILEPPLYQAQEFLAELRGRIAQDLTTAAAESAVFAGQMTQKVAQQLAEPVLDAGAWLNNAQSRIAADLSQPVFDAAGFGERFGVFPELNPGEIPPASVLETRARLGVPGLGIPPGPTGAPLVVDAPTWDKAWADFVGDVLPMRSMNFPAYQTRLAELEGRFPPGSSWWREFQRKRDELESKTSIGFPAEESDSPLTRPITRPTVPVPGTGETVQGPATVVSKPSPRPVPPGMGGPPGGSPAYPPGSIVPGNPGPFPNIPTVAPIGPDGCVYFAPERPIVFNGGQMEPRPAAHWVPLYYPPGWGTAGTPLADGGYWWGYVNPICNPTPPSPFPSPITPAPGPSPPASGPAPCVSICGMDALIDALKGGGDGKPCPKWKAWRDVESGECYVQPADQEPRHSVDEFILESSDAAAIVAAVNEKCGPPKPAQEKPRPEAPLVPGQAVRGCDWLLPVEIPGAPQVVNPVGYWLGVTNADGTPRPLPGETSGSWFWGPLQRYYASFWRLVGEKFAEAFNRILRANPCVSGANVALISLRALLNFVGIFVGDSLSQVKTPLTQHSNFLCPVGMPDYSQATAAWLRNAISAETRDCWVRACGMRDELWTIIAESQRSRLNPDQLTRLLFREEISPDEYAARIRELGFIRESDPIELRKLGQNLPGPQDVVRFMQRDVSDPKIVGRFGLDDDFAAKYQGETKRFADAAGVSPEAMRMYWRAHWSIPSPTQLYEMLHRLGNLDPSDPNYISQDDVKTALQQQDILPYWVDKLMAVSFRPLRLVDTQRAFRDGSIDDNEVKRVYRDIGYNERDAEILTNHQRRQKQLAGLRLPGAKAYMAGAVGFQAWAEELATFGYSAIDGQELRQVALSRMKQIRTAACVKSLKRRTLRGEWDPVDAQQQLMALGLDQDQAELLAQAWGCERNARGKELTGAQLCKLYSEGMIDGPTMVQRLVRAGWDRDDAIKIFGLCSTAAERKRKAEELRKIRQEEQEAEKQAKTAAANQRALEAKEKQAASAKDRLVKLARQRERVLVDAGAQWSRRFEGDLSESIAAAKRIYRRIADTTTVPRDDIIKAVHVAARAKTVEDESRWMTEAIAIAQGAERPETV